LAKVQIEIAETRLEMGSEFKALVVIEVRFREIEKELEFRPE
jgi:hypothetical protein